MSKFKVGDRVRRVSNFREALGPYFTGVPFDVASIRDDVVIDPNGGNHSEVFLAHEPALPVRTRTITEIVPGKYAGFHVGANDAGRVHVVQGTDEMYTAAELRAAARVFVSLAEALEENEVKP